MAGPRNLLAQLPYHKLRVDLVANPITTAAWLALSTALPKACVAVQIYYTGVGILKISDGDMGEEDDHEKPMYIVPGGESCMVPIELAKGKRFSAQALDQDADEGELVINFFG